MMIKKLALAVGATVALGGAGVAHAGYLETATNFKANWEFSGFRNADGSQQTDGTVTLNFPVEFRGGLFNNDNGTATWTGPMALLSNTTMNLANPVVLAGVVLLMSAKR